MNDLLRPVFLCRLTRFQLLERALADQEQLLLGEVPKFLKRFRRQVSTVREGIEETLAALVDDPLNRFLKALQDAGVSWKFEHRRDKPDEWDYGESPEAKVELACFYLRVCKALADANKPLTIQGLKPLVPSDRRSSIPRLSARRLRILRDAGLIVEAGETRRPYVPYDLTGEGRELIQAIFAS